MRSLCLLVVFMFTGASLWAKVNLAPTSLQKDAAGLWMYEKVLDVPGADRDALYERAKKWVLANVKSVDQNQITDDPKHESLVTTVTLSLGKLWTFYSSTSVSFKLVLDFKDSKMRIGARSFTYYAIGTSSSFGIQNSPLETYRDEKAIVKRIDERIDEAFPTFIQSLEAGMQKSTTDW